MTTVRFLDRADAGRRLAAAVRTRVGEDVVVLGLPRGGIPVAAQVAQALAAPLDVLCVRKIGLPGHAEFAVGAIAEDDAQVLDRDTIARLAVAPAALQAVIEREQQELERQTTTFRAGRPPVPLQGRSVVVVDDGLATGATARAAVDAARRRGARRVTVAVPVAAPESADAVRLGADALVTVIAPVMFGAVGQWYERFDPTTDAEVLRALAAATGTPRAGGPAEES